MKRKALNTIIALENAYSKKDLNQVLFLKDFNTEAKMTLEKEAHDVTPKLVNEVAELLKLSLVKHLQDNGYPDFTNATREFSDFKQIKDNIYILTEEITHDNGEFFKNKVTLSKQDDDWKIVTVEDA